MNRSGYYQQRQPQGDVKYNYYDDNSLVGGLSGRQIYATNTLPPLQRGPTLAPPGNSLDIYINTPLIMTNSVLTLHHISKTEMHSSIVD